MTVFFELLNYGLILLFGILLSVSFSGGYSSKKERFIIAFLYAAAISAQILCWRFCGFEFVRRCYPLISHLPVIFTLVFLLKRPWAVAFTSVLTAYFCCQLPRWIGTVSLYLFNTESAYQAAYLFSIFPIFFLLKKHLSIPAYKAMTYSNRSALLFGGLPLFYYLFDYATNVYTKSFYLGNRIVSESLPAAMALFYTFFVTAYHNEMQKRSQAELHNSMLEMQFQQAKNDIIALQKMQTQTAAYRHDMRHHFSMISSYLQSGNAERAAKYIQSAESDIEAITPKNYCQNVSVNLIFSWFAEKAKKLGVALSVEANIPDNLPVSESELAALISNGIENAVFAASQCDGTVQKLVRISCQIHKQNLLIYIKNPYKDDIKMQNGLPQSFEPQHGFGVKSIKMIAEMYGGYCSFEAKEHIFTLKAVLPLVTNTLPSDTCMV